MRIVIPVYERFTALDAVGPYEVLSRLPGAEVRFAAAARGAVRTDTGALAVVADAALDEVAGCDILVVPGGPGSAEVARDPHFTRWVRAMDATSTWTTSVCTGSEILGAAGLLAGLEATTHWSVTDTLSSFGATYTPRRVVVAGKVVTAAGVSAGIDMALTLVSLLAGREMAEAIQLGIEYDPQPPFDSGSPVSADPATVELVAAVLAASRPAG